MNSRSPFLSLLLLITTTSFISAQLPMPPKAEESWSTPALTGSKLKVNPPLVGTIDDEPLFHRELLRLGWRYADPIDLYVIIPKAETANGKTDVTNVKVATAKVNSANAKTEGSVSTKPPVIIYLYNYTSTPDRYTHNNVCQHLTKGGVAAVGVPSNLSPTRFLFRGGNKWFVSELQEGLATTAHDVQLVINYLETRRDLDTSRIGVFGEGSGAAVAVLAASVDPRIKVLDLEDAWGDWPEWLAKSTIVPEAERPTYLKPEFLSSVAGLDPVDYLPKLTIPVRSQYSSPKSGVPAEVRKRIEAALPTQAAHTPPEPNFDWIKNQLIRMHK